MPYDENSTLQGGSHISVRVEFEETANGNWRWKAYDQSSDDGDLLAEVRSGQGYKTEAEAQDGFDRASLHWVVVPSEEE